MDDPNVVMDGTQCLVAIGARLTAVEAPALQAALKKQIDAGARVIVFDLGAVQALDSTGIGLLVAASNSMAGVEGAVRLMDVSPDIMKLLRSMRLVDRLNATAREASSG